MQAGHFYKSWIDVDSTVKTVFGFQEGAAKGYNPFKRGALSYNPQVAFRNGPQKLDGAISASSGQAAILAADS